MPSSSPPSEASLRTPISRRESLGLVSRSESSYKKRRRPPLPRKGVMRFVSESQIRGDIVCDQLLSERPGLRRTPLEFDEDDVDWHLEYLFRKFANWWTTFATWFQSWRVFRVLRRTVVSSFSIFLSSSRESHRSTINIQSMPGQSKSQGQGSNCSSDSESNQRCIGDPEANFLDVRPFHRKSRYKRSDEESNNAKDRSLCDARGTVLSLSSTRRVHPVISKFNDSYENDRGDYFHDYEAVRPTPSPRPSDTIRRIDMLNSTRHNGESVLT